jgi:hypothetical protein
MTSVDADLRIGRRLEYGRRSESIILVCIYFMFLKSASGIKLNRDPVPQDH